MLFSREDTVQTGQNRLKSHTKRQTGQDACRQKKKRGTVSQEDKETRRRTRRGGEGGKGAGKRGLGAEEEVEGGGAVMGDKEIKRQTGKQTDRQCR